MNHDSWKNRIAERNDITGHLVHLTKAAEIDGEKYSAIEVLYKIIKDRELIGSTTKTGFICGRTSAVCLQEAPLYSLTQNIYYEQKVRAENKGMKIRYVGMGLMVTKPFAYKQGGRPVVYDKTSDAKEYLPESEWWRIVNLDLSNNENIIDWTHEREWRVPNNLEFSLSNISVILPNSKAYKKFIEMCEENGDEKIIKNVKSIINLGDLFY
jgi:hypothetical protein